MIVGENTHIKSDTPTGNDIVDMSSDNEVNRRKSPRLNASAAPTVTLKEVKVDPVVNPKKINNKRPGNIHVQTLTLFMIDEHTYMFTCTTTLTSVFTSILFFR